MYSKSAFETSYGYQVPSGQKPGTVTYTIYGTLPHGLTFANGVLSGTVDDNALTNDFFVIAHSTTLGDSTPYKVT
ncbi:hypothetical protein FACS1894166_09130 [Bacilli bacterium]|nr:hypothetical protein FACS1894166_09130 [Bacilli bacterium]